MLKISTLSFPGLGIGEFDVNSVAFRIGSIEVAWYGVLIGIGMILACLYVIWRAGQVGINSDTVIDYAIFTVLAGVIGARVYYVLAELDQYRTFWDAIAVWNGGLAIYGGVIGGALAIICVSKYKKISTFKMMDCVAPAVMIGQIIGRWGNFINAEAYGYETTLPWRMGIKDFLGTTQYYHPTFLYESIWNTIGFVLINLFYKHKKYDGQIVLMYFAWYGFGRMFIESLRTDSLYIGPFRKSQVLAAICFVICGGILLGKFISAKINEKNKAGD